ncbi:MAG: protease complex subunit PrcB family protein [Candidatus Hydrothermae bacterium]|nr:protease complex subunit PrcB family protein [Candidatus Hydrothermae bacterium]
MGVTWLWIGMMMLNPAPRTIPFEVVAEGKTSGFTQKTFEVIRDETSWKAVFERLQERVMPKQPVPEQDFQQFTLILVAAGQGSVMNRSIRVTRVFEQNHVLYVDVEICEPRAGAITLPAFSQPYQVIRIPRWEGTVEFLEQRCEHP